MQYPRIRELRQERRLTQHQMADLLHISPSAYFRYERGISDIPMGVICSMAIIHHTSVDYLAGITDQRILHRKRE